VEKIDLVSGESRILEMASGAEVIGLNIFFSVKKVYEED